ncbi:MAG: hypothetical protein AB7F43_13045 [Bacteriovoracia bacterium]
MKRNVKILSGLVAVVLSISASSSFAQTSEYQLQKDRMEIAQQIQSLNSEQKHVLVEALETDIQNYKQALQNAKARYYGSKVFYVVTSVTSSLAGIFAIGTSGLIVTNGVLEALAVAKEYNNWNSQHEVAKFADSVFGAINGTKTPKVPNFSEDFYVGSEKIFQELEKNGIKAFHIGLAASVFVGGIILSKAFEQASEVSAEEKVQLEKLLEETSSKVAIYKELLGISEKVSSNQ